jgi:hypothetical protein
MNHRPTRPKYNTSKRYISSVKFKPYDAYETQEGAVNAVKDYRSHGYPAYYKKDNPKARLKYTIYIDDSNEDRKII